MKQNYKKLIGKKLKENNLSQIQKRIEQVVSEILSENLQENFESYENILEDLAISYLENGGTEDSLNELFSGLRQRGKQIISRAAGALKQAGRIAGRVGLSASLVASPVWGPKQTTPAVQGSDGTPAVVQPATPDKVIPGNTVKPTGKFVISGERDLKTGKPRLDPKSPSGLKRGSDQIEIGDADAAEKHSAPGSLTHKQAVDAKAAAAKQSTPARVIPGTPAKVIQPATGAKPDLPARNTWSLTAVPNMRDRDLPKGIPAVQQGDAFVGKRRRTTTTGNTNTGGGGGSSMGGGGSSMGGGGSGGGSSGGGLRPYPKPVPPTPVLSRMSVGTRSTNLERGVLSGSNPGRAGSISGSGNNPILMKKIAAATGEQSSWTTGISTPVVGRQAAFGSVPSIRPRPQPRKGVLFRENIEEYKQKILQAAPLTELNVLGVMKSDGLVGAARAITHNIRTRGLLGGTVSRSAALEAGRERASRLGTIGHMQSLRRGAEAKSELGLPSSAGAGQVADKLRYDDGKNPKLNAILAGTDRAVRRIDRSQRAVAKIDRMRGVRPPLSESRTQEYKQILINEIGDTPAGQETLKSYVRLRTNDLVNTAQGLGYDRGSSDFKNLPYSERRTAAAERVKRNKKIMSYTVGINRAVDRLDSLKPKEDIGDLKLEDEPK